MRILKTAVLMGLIATGTMLGMCAGVQAASTLDGYDRAKVANSEYVKMHGTKEMPEAKNDPELAATMKKYVFGDIAKQTKITNTERQLVTIVVLATGRNHKMLGEAVTGALNTGVKPLEVREALYHIAPYIGFPKTFEALEITNNAFKKAGIKLPLPKQGTTTDEDRFAKGLQFQLDKYGERINTMRNNTPDYQKHLIEDFGSFFLGET